MSTGAKAGSRRVVRGAAPERDPAAVARPELDGGGRWASAVRRSQGNRNRQGTVIAALVRARLLGVNILNIDARVVLMSAADDVPDVTPVVARAKALTRSTERSMTQGEGQGADLAYAVRLLEEGSKSLDEVRGMRASSGSASASEV
jgi:hypothetical protein